MKCIFILLSLLFLLMGSNGYAGWISSGGELFRDGKNPWFVNNTKEITYCLKYSAASISIAQNEVEAKIIEAFAYWQAEFKKQSPGGSSTRIEIATQTVRLVGCDQSPDLRILLGYESLSAEEVLGLGDPTHYIGVTVRTDYDDVNLKGTGFIYISSDFGSHAYDNGGNLVLKAWSEPKLLDYALRHELGHVFGLPHEGTGLMSEVFLDQLLNKSNYAKFGTIEIPSYLMPDSDFEVCSGVFGRNGSIEPGFFQTGATAIKCIGVHTVNFGTSNTWEISSKEVPGGPATVIGKIAGNSFSLMDLNVRPAVVVQITNAQKVFSFSDTLGKSFLYGPSFIDMGLNANLILGGSTVKPVYMKITPNSVRIFATYNGSIKPVLSYDSPINILLQMN